MTCIIRWSLLKDISIYYSKTISVSFRSTVKERPDILQGKLNRFLSISSPWFELFTEAFPRRNCPSTLRHCFASGVVAIENSWRASFELLFQHFTSIKGSQRGDDSVEEEKLLKGNQEYNRKGNLFLEMICNRIHSSKEGLLLSSSSDLFIVPPHSVWTTNRFSNWQQGTFGLAPSKGLSFKEYLWGD